MIKVCQSDLANTDKELSGENSETLKSKADSMVAFGKIADRVEQNTHSKSQSFRGGPSTSRYTGGAGKNPKSYQKTGQSHPLFKVEPVKKILPPEPTTKARFFNSDWMLDPTVLTQLQTRFGLFSVDLFASFQNTPKVFQLETKLQWML